MKTTTPFNIVLMNVDQFISDNKLLEVTSPFIHEPSTSNFHKEGIFSEDVFGLVASQDRLIRL